jgi:hypothetical protein
LGYDFTIPARSTLLRMGKARGDRNLFQEALDKTAFTLLAFGIAVVTAFAPSVYSEITHTYARGADPSLTHRLGQAMTPGLVSVIAGVTVVALYMLFVLPLAQRNQARRQRDEALGDLEGRRLADHDLAIVVEVKELSGVWSGATSVETDNLVTLAIVRVPIYLVNRSTTRPVNLRFECEATFGNFADHPETLQSDPIRTESRRSSDANFMPNPKHLSQGDNANGVLNFVFVITGLNLTHHNEWLLSDVTLSVRDEQSRGRFRLAIPGSVDTSANATLVTYTD